jgi:hypothetical protein
MSRNLHDNIKRGLGVNVRVCASDLNYFAQVASGIKKKAKMIFRERAPAELRRAVICCSW